VGTEETFDLSAAGLRADGTDLRISIEVLASKLETSARDVVTRAHARTAFWRGSPGHTIELFAVGTAIVPREGHDEAIEAPTTVLDLS
jgi:hypothetical protein